MTIIVTIIIAAVTLCAGFGVGWLVQRNVRAGRAASAETQVASLVKEATENAERLVRDAKLEAKDIKLAARQEVETEAKERREEISKLEKHLFQKEEVINKKTEYLDSKEEQLRAKELKNEKTEKTLEEKKEKLDGLIAEQSKELERVAGLTCEEAKKQLIDSMVEEAKHDAARLLRQIEDDTKEQALTKTQNILALSIQRYAGEYVAERTVSVVGLPNDDMKGRIIGREGRNIRAIEAATGIDLIIDDTPEAVVLSGFNPIKREIARRALESLISDGRIHPARIEDVVAKAEADLEAQIKEFGQQAAFDLGIHGLHPEIIKLLGRLRYRTSYGQNVWTHSMEVAYIAGVLADELGLPSKLARRAGLLHDIGKAVTHEIEGSHAVIGAGLAKKYGESPKIVHAIGAHHEDEKPETVLAILVQAADAVSGARPGARREIMESYVKRLEDLENIANGFMGVDKSYAIQAGREVRVIVSSERISDDDSVVLAHDIAKKIETDLTYPGQIRVTVIRETRATSIAN